MEKVSGSGRHIWHRWHISLPEDPGIRFNAVPESNSARKPDEFCLDPGLDRSGTARVGVTPRFVDRGERPGPAGLGMAVTAGSDLL